MNKPEELQKPGIWKTITTTVIVCVAVFGFISKHTIDLKNAEIALLERENKQLSEVGAVPEAVKNLQTQIKNLQNQLRPLTMVTHIDPISGKCDMGVISFGTELTTDLIEAQKLVKEKKFDLALDKAVEMEDKLPDFIGAAYIRFLVNQAKGYREEAAKYATLIIEKLPQDTRIENIYVFFINYKLSRNEKKEAEDLAIQAMQLWPDNQELLESFRQVFGYVPTIAEKKTETKSQ